MPHFDVQWNDQQIDILRILTLIASVLSLVGTLFIVYSYAFVQTNTPFSKRRKRKKRNKLLWKQQELEKARKLKQKHLEELLLLQIQSLEHETQQDIPQETEAFLRFNTFVFFLSLAHLLNSVVWILLIALQGSKDEIYCQILAPLNVYLFGVSFGWTILIATEIGYRFTHTTVSMFGETVVPESITGMKEIWFHLFAWVAPLFVIIIPSASGDFGKGVWSCWLKDPNNAWVYIFGVIVGLTMVYCTSVYLYVTVIFRKRLEMSGTLGEEERRKAVFLQTRVSTYLLVFILCWAPAFIRNFAGLFDPPASTALFILTAVGAFFLPLNGFLDSLVYGTSKPLWEKVCAHLKRNLCICGWCGFLCCGNWACFCCRKSGYDEIADDTTVGTELAIQDEEGN